jgi:hypothetical protein
MQALLGRAAIRTTMSTPASIAACKKRSTVTQLRPPSGPVP